MDHKKKVAYYYDPEIGNYYYGNGHPMKPHRVRMAHSLIMRYGLHKHLEMFTPVMATEEQLYAFHTKEYISFLKALKPQNKDKFQNEIKKFSVQADCPIFTGMFEFCQRYTGGSLGGAVRLNYGLSDIVINWSGGLHHAKRSEAAGFCYVNDIVLAILELLKYHHRVLYLDIDVHHGDGVEEAFLTTDRVMTVSFHKHGNNFFPGTGAASDVGAGPGKYYSVNVPLKDGIDDDSYWFLFRPIMTRIMEVYRPGAIVLQSGADSLAHDKLGVFNLSIKGHAACHRLMSSFGVPLLVLGGGGYKIKNVARCWTYETGVLLHKEQAMQDQMPPNEYYEHFGPDYSLHIPQDKTLENCNKRQDLEKLRNVILENLKNIAPVSAPFMDSVPDLLRPEDVSGRRRRGRRGSSGSPGSQEATSDEGGDDGEMEAVGKGGDDEEEEDGGEGGGGGVRARARARRARRARSRRHASYEDGEEQEVGRRACGRRQPSYEDEQEQEEGKEAGEEEQEEEEQQPGRRQRRGSKRRATRRRHVEREVETEEAQTGRGADRANGEGGREGEGEEEEEQHVRRRSSRRRAPRRRHGEQEVETEEVQTGPGDEEGGGEDGEGEGVRDGEREREGESDGMDVDEPEVASGDVRGESEGEGEDSSDDGSGGSGDSDEGEEEGEVTGTDWEGEDEKGEGEQVEEGGEQEGLDVGGQEQCGEKEQGVAGEQMEVKEAVVEGEEVKEEGVEEVVKDVQAQQVTVMEEGGPGGGVVAVQQVLQVVEEEAKVEGEEGGHQQQQDMAVDPPAAPEPSVA